MGKIAALHIFEEVNNDMGQDDVRTLRQQQDRIIYLLEGEADVPGLVRRVAVLEELLLGSHGKDGMIHQVRAMWNIRVWVMCALSAAGGFIVKELVAKFIH